MKVAVDALVSPYCSGIFVQYYASNSLYSVIRWDLSLSRMAQKNMMPFFFPKVFQNSKAIK